MFDLQQYIHHSFRTRFNTERVNVAFNIAAEQWVANVENKTYVYQIGSDDDDLIFVNINDKNDVVVIADPTLFCPNAYDCD